MIAVCRFSALCFALFLLATCFVSVDCAIAAEAPADAEAGIAGAVEKPQTPAAESPAVPDSVRQPMQDRKYDEAVKAIDAAVQAGQGPADYLTYLKGRALFLAEKHDDAAAVLESLEKKYPDSGWVRRARFARAIALARKGDFRGAEFIYRAEAESLLDPERKQKVADIYLDFADEFYDPPEEDVDPDYDAALEFYEQALEVTLKPDVRTRIELRIARCYQETDELEEAIELYQAFIQEHDKSPLLIEARFHLGDCQLMFGELADARRTWQDLLAIHQGSKSERMAEAAFNLAYTYDFPYPDHDEDLELGVAVLRAFIAKYPEHKLAAKAHLHIGESYQHRGRLDDAVKSLTAFIADARYADSEVIPEARHLLGICYKDQKKYDETLSAWREYLTEHPTHPDWSEVQREIINVEYTRAWDSYRAEDYDSARRLWGEFLAKYPLDQRNRQIQFLLGYMLFEEEKWDDAMTQWRRLVSKYPDTNESSKAQYWIAYTLEEKLGRLDEALKQYKEVTWGNFESKAEQRIARLTAKQMAIATERVFRSDETPQLKLVTRNIERVTVRIYKVNLETYFRKMHLARGVEGLDIALIDPNRIYEFEVPDYQELQRIESLVPVTLEADEDIPPEGGGAIPPEDGTKNSGVMAVTVSSKTFEATTLVIQSDLDVIVKSSRDEAFVFAQNMRTGKPWPGATVLISDGDQVFAELATGPDGVLQQSFDELESAEDVRVFAVHDGHVASNVVRLSGVGMAQGLARRGYIYTDRPAYRAGQIAHVRGVIRQVTDDTYTVAKDKKYQVEVYDHRNRLVGHEEVSLNDFGAFHTHFLLPATAPQGDYRITVHDDDEESYQGTFKVHEYKLEPVRITVDTPRSVYYRGEEIEGTIKAAFYYGAPLVDREVEYQLADGRTYTDRTDKKGEVHFKLPTRDFRETQALTLKVSLPERELQHSENFFLATQGFVIQASTVRPVYLAGDTFELTARTLDAEGETISKDLTLRVMKLADSDDDPFGAASGETLVEEHAVKTDEKEGTARKTLRLAEGGVYILRLEGTDRFGNPVSGGTRVNISGEEDEVRLRILADQHTYKVGDQADVQLHWREEPALALVTFQGARILDYQLVELKTGANQLEIPMATRLAPNFDLAVAVMTDPRPEDDVAPADGDAPGESEKDGKEKVVRRFHTASSPFTVERDLLVKLDVKPKGDAKTVRPGDDVEVTVSTTDPQGKPVAAEVSVALVEQALLAKFSSPLPAIDQYFKGAARRSAMRTTSSCTFDYRPSTQPINERLLAEEERLALAEEERKRVAAIRGGDRPFVTSVVPVFDDDEGDGDAEMDPFWGAAADDVGIGGGLGGGAFGFDAARTEGGGGQSVLEGFDKADAFAATLREKGAVLLPHLPPHETAYWNPAVATGDDGTATVTVTLPPQSTAWNLMAKGITVETLAGEATDEFAVKKDLFGQLKLPAALTDGDEIQIEASVHNGVMDEGRISVKLKMTIGEKSLEETKTIDVQSKGIQSIGFPLEIALPDDAASSGNPGGTAVFELTVTAEGEDGQSDTIRQTVPVRPYGMPVYSVAGGSAESDAIAFVEPPKEMTLSGQSLTVMIGPTVDRSLLDVLFAPAPACQIETGSITSGSERAVSDLMAALALQKLVAAGRDAAGPHAKSLDSRIRSTISLLISQQNDDGGWDRDGRRKQSRTFTTARTFWALQLAKDAGYRIADDALESASDLLDNRLLKARLSDYEQKTILLHALAVAGKEDFPLANALYRNRQFLSTSSLIHLALTFAEMDRKETAAELLAVLADRNFNETAPKRTNLKSCLPWCNAPAELRALYALALVKVAPADERLKQQVEWLMAHRTGHRWSPEKATGPAMLALCDWYARTKFQGEKYRLTVFVNDFKVQELTVDDQSLTQSIDVPPKLLADKGRQQVRFEIAGRGRYTYQCVLGGFVPADKLKSTTYDWTVERLYEPAPLSLDGKAVPRGFELAVLGTYTRFHNEMTQLPVARRGEVQLIVERGNVPPGTPDEHLEYLVVTEALPAGTTVVEDSIRGGFARYELMPGAITFHIANMRRTAPIRFDVHGYLPGTYRMQPTLVRNAYAPSQIAVGKPTTLTVLPLGERSSDEYRLTPHELYALAQRRFDKGELKQAAVHLTELIENWQVKPDVFKQAARMLMDIHVETGSAAEIVRSFEVVIEKYPTYEIPFAQLMKIGDAYDKIGEYERSYLVFRATVEGSFLRESQVAGFLERQDEFMRSVDVMASLLREYPPEAYVASATYALAQRVYAAAPTAADDEKLREAKITRVDLIRQSLGMLDSFLTEYPDDPANDEASFSLASGLLDLDLHREALAACQRYMQRYPDSDFLDTYQYIIGFCHYALGEHEQALAMCRKVAEATRRNPETGRQEESPNKWRAVYILGQVYHSLGQAAKAIEEYTRVEDRFVDARQAIEYFARKNIELPEVTTFRPGEAAELELEYRNVASCDVKVYRIDLMKFSLLKRNLGGITQINLAGISPLHTATIALGDGKDYQDKSKPLPLPIKEEGAYLVVCRGEDLHASGLVLVSPLVAEVQEDARSGRVRTTVRDTVADQYVADVHVKVIGSGNEDFTSGETDLRGIFVVDDIRGTATVIAEAPGRRYAFHRGSVHIGAAPEDGDKSDPFGADAGGDPMASDDLLEGIKGQNEGIQSEQQQELDELYDNPNQGGFGGAGGFF